jgi:hypothetical protein
LNRRLLQFLPAVLLLGGCASVGEIGYADAQLELPPIASSKSLAVTVLEQRTYVIFGDRKEDFTGAVRSGAAVPYPLATRSGDPLAAEMTQALAAALSKQGRTTRAVVVPMSAGRQGAHDALKASGAERLLLFGCRDWKTDSRKNTRLDYDLTLEVLDAGGALLANKQISGSRLENGVNIDGAEEVAHKWFAEMFGELLADPGIANALR